MARNRAAVADTAKTPKAHNFLGPRLREGAFIAVSAICLYLLLALLTHSPQDPGWSATGTGARSGKPAERAASVISCE